MILPRAVIAGLVCVGASLALTHASGADASSFTIGDATYSTVPCPNQKPDRLVTRWRLSLMNPSPHTRTGRVVTTSKVDVIHVFNGVCNTSLVKYAGPHASSCPGDAGEGDYRMTFSRRGQTLLVAIAHLGGCPSLSIVGHTDLGAGMDYVYLAPGVPTPYGE